MNILDFADLINKQIIIRYYYNQNKRFTAEFSNSEIKEGNLLIGTYGNGSTPEEAIKNYCEKISNKLIVFNAMSKVREEYQLKELNYEKKQKKTNAKKLFKKN
jgi:hypothetical protein